MEHAEYARRGRTLSEHVHRLRVPALAALLAGVAACGDTRTDDAPPAPEARPAADPAPTPMADIRPPEFLGADTVELLGLEYFRVTWTPATDDETPVEGIRYNVYHVVEPYLELSDDAQPIFATEPGATEAVFANDAPPGRFYVRAVDAAGNLSEITTGLLQRPSRPVHRVPGGALAARITRCAATPGGGLCAGQEGLTGWWTDDGWQTHDLGLVSRDADRRHTRGALPLLGCRAPVSLRRRRHAASRRRELPPLRASAPLSAVHRRPARPALLGRRRRQGVHRGRA